MSCISSRTLFISSISSCVKGGFSIFLPHLLIQLFTIQYYLILLTTIQTYYYSILLVNLIYAFFVGMPIHVPIDALDRAKQRPGSVTRSIANMDFKARLGMPRNLFRRWRGRGFGIVL